MSEKQNYYEYTWRVVKRFWIDFPTPFDDLEVSQILFIDNETEETLCKSLVTKFFYRPQRNTRSLRGQTGAGIEYLFNIADLPSYISQRFCADVNVTGIDDCASRAKQKLI